MLPILIKCKSFMSEVFCMYENVDKNELHFHGIYFIYFLSIGAIDPGTFCIPCRNWVSPCESIYIYCEHISFSSPAIGKWIVVLLWKLRSRVITGVVVVDVISMHIFLIDLNKCLWTVWLLVFWFYVSHCASSDNQHSIWSVLLYTWTIYSKQLQGMYTKGKRMWPF